MAESDDKADDRRDMLDKLYAENMQRSDSLHAVELGLLRMYRAELHAARDYNRQLVHELRAIRDELALWRQVGQVAAARKRSRTTQRMIVPNGTRPIWRS